jgi:hypothetical protein
MSAVVVRRLPGARHMWFWNDMERVLVLGVLATTPVPKSRLGDYCRFE